MKQLHNPGESDSFVVFFGSMVLAGGLIGGLIVLFFWIAAWHPVFLQVGAASVLFYLAYRVGRYMVKGED